MVPINFNMSDDQLVERLFNHVKTMPASGSHVIHGHGDDLNFHLNTYFLEECSLDVDSDRISAQTVVYELRERLLDAADSDNPVEEFEQQVSEYVSEVKQADWDTFEIAFPLNMLPQGNSTPNEFFIKGTTIERLEVKKWSEECLRQAKIEEENRDFTKFMRRTPNEPDDTDYTYWTLECETYDLGYALHIAYDRLQLLCAKLNYADALWGLGRKSSLPRVRWSRLREPFFFLTFDGDGEYLAFHIHDYDNRIPQSITWEQEETRDIFNNIPDFGESSHKVESDIIAALQSYQIGMAETSKQQSFFAFWRGIEVLSQKEPHEPAEVAKERAAFALEFVGPEIGREKIYNRTLSEFENIRNSIAHEGDHISMSSYHQHYAKLLLDGLLTFYFQHWDDLDSVEEYRTVLEYGSKSDHGRRSTREKYERMKSAIELVSDDEQKE